MVVKRPHPTKGCALLADMELDIERAKELIEQKLAEEEEEEKVGPWGRGIHWHYVLKDSVKRRLAPTMLVLGM